jgi:polyisoprenoid-binding protein YceI
MVGLLGNPGVAFSQALYRIDAGQAMEMRLSGTSTLHDWEMDAKDVAGEAHFDFRTGSTTELSALGSLSFILQVVDLRSDSKGLDKNAYAALKAKEHKDIRYHLTSSTLAPSKNGQLLKTKGKLTIAGVTRNIDMDVHCVVNANGTITCSGMADLKMTDYQVEPPKFMFGAMSTGDAIVLRFSVIYKAV